MPTIGPLALSPDKPLPTEVDAAVTVTYRSSGLGLWGTLIRGLGMPLEKVALTANSSQVSGKGQYA